MKDVMTQGSIAVLAAATLAATGASAQVPQPVPLAGQPPLLTLTAEAEVRSAPDVADIGAGVVTQAAEAEAALSANNARMARVIAALRRAGVAERDIQTSGLSVQPQFRYAENQPPTLTGFQASNRVQVTLRNLGGAGRVIDALVKEGANQIDGPKFRVAEPDALMDRARAEAVRKARARADLYAEAAELRVVRIVSISEGFAQRPPMPMMRAQAASMDAAESAPVAPGQVGLVATVGMAFELAPR